jgi:hypothetical protein
MVIIIDFETPMAPRRLERAFWSCAMVVAETVMKPVGVRVSAGFYAQAALERKPRARFQAFSFAERTFCRAGRAWPQGLRRRPFDWR